MSVLDWSEIYKQLPKPRLSYFYQKSTESEFLVWIQSSDRNRRALAYLWLSDLVSLDLEIRRAVAEAKASKGASVTDDPEASHMPFRYHADNACYRMFALLEKASYLLNGYLILNVERPSFKKVAQRIREHAELSKLDSIKPFLELEASEWYEALSEYRHSLSHRLSPVSQDQSSLLGMVKGLAQFLEFKPIGYTIDQLDNLISEGHRRTVAIIEASEKLLKTTPSG